jgi:hypothetical protein
MVSLLVAASEPTKKQGQEFSGGIGNLEFQKLSCSKEKI